MNVTNDNDSATGPDSKQIDLILSNIDRLPTLPAVATRLMSISSAEDIDLDEVIRLIESDPAMSTTILSMCRTADKGLGDRITTVRRAVIMLGLEAVQVAALSVHVYNQLESTSSDEECTLFDRPGFWIHSLAVACGAQEIASAHPHLNVSPDEAYLAGLLHDLGKLALDLILPKAYERVLGMSKARSCGLCLIERTMLGLDHHTAGKRLAEHWKLSSPIRDAIWLHSQPIESLPEGANKSLVSIITLAESWARDMHLGWAGDYGEALDIYEQSQQVGVDHGFFKSNAARIIEGVSMRGTALGLGEHAEQDLLIESLTAANRKLANLNLELRNELSDSSTHAVFLESIEVFYSNVQPGERTDSVLCAMVESASVLVGSSRAAVIYQTKPNGPWFTMKIDQGEIVESSRRVKAPESEHETVRPGMLADSNAAQSMELASLDWLRELFLSVKEIGAPLLLGTRVAHGACEDDGPSFLIIMPKTGSGRERMLSSPSFTRVRDLWQHTLSQAVLSEKSRRIGEELAAANHAMTALRNELTTKESLVQLGKMAAGAAHEMNNPLAIIRGRSQQLFERVGTERERESARAIAAASDQLSDLITSLHMIADPPEPNLALADPVLMVRQAVEIARDRCHFQNIKARIQMNTEGAPQPMFMDIDMLAHAVAEPIINAVQASPDAIISVCIESESRDGRLKIQVLDRGSGFTSKSIKHAFDPFFSELAAGRRSGLGLARARGLIELHKGEIFLGNNTGKMPGAEVVIYLDKHLGEHSQAA
jgi:HD-like signal output (HDOD) protein/signal transduction histidine kinase